MRRYLGAKMDSITVTYDWNMVPIEMPLFMQAKSAGYIINLTEASLREAAGSSFEISFEFNDNFTESCTYSFQSSEHNLYLPIPVIPEMAIPGQMTYLAKGIPPTGNQIYQFEQVVKIISNGSISNPRFIDNFSPGQKRIILDAKTFCSHVIAGRDCFVTKDKKAFIDRGRRDKLEQLASTKILSSEEFQSLILK